MPQALLIAARRGRISHLKMGRTDRGIMKLLTSKQAAESPADGRADGESAARLGCEQNDSPDFSWMLIEWSSQAAQHVFAQCVCACMCEGLQICKGFGICLHTEMCESSQSHCCLSHVLSTKALVERAMYWS